MCDQILEEFFEPTSKQSKEIEKQKHKTPNLPETTEHQKLRSRTTGYDYEIMFGPQPDNFVPKNPFASLAQARYMHVHPEILGSKIKEWDKSTNFKKIPKKK